MCILLDVMWKGYNILQMQFDQKINILIYLSILQMDKKLYFMRHATSQHNSEKTNFRTTKH